MNKNKYLLYLLLCGLMLYIAMPRLDLASGGSEALFAGSWLFLALLVFAGNLAAFLYTPKKQAKFASQDGKQKRKTRGFTG
jgi:hypothetical protein